ncbi:MAG: septum formation initiator family protein [Patescibacteria group bacterium]
MLARKGKNKKTIQTLFLPVIFILLFFAVTGFLVISNWNINQKRDDLNVKIESLRKEVQDLEGKKVELEKGINLSQSQEYLETVARESLDLKKPGEDVVVVKQPAIMTEETAGQEKDFWQKILEKIGL